MQRLFLNLGVVFLICLANAWEAKATALTTRDPWTTDNSGQELHLCLELFKEGMPYRQLGSDNLPAVGGGILPSSWPCLWNRGRRQQGPRRFQFGSSPRSEACQSLLRSRPSVDQETRARQGHRRF